MNQGKHGRGLFVYAVTLVIVLAACSGPGSSTGGSSGAGASGTATKTYRVAVVLPTISINILHDVYQGTLDKAAEIGNIEVIETGQLDATEFLNDCLQIVATGVDALIYDSIDAVGHAPCIKEANKNGIPVVCLVACVSEGTNDATVTIDAENDGKLMGEWVVDTIGGSGEVGFLEGAPGDAFGLAIGTGFKKAIEACSGCDLVADVAGGVDRNTAYTTALTVMTGNPELKAIAGSNDDVGLGLVQAAQQQGVLDQMAISGHGGSCNGLASILAGEMGFTILIPGNLTGATGLEAAWELIQGGTITETRYIDAVGLDTEMAQGILAGTTPNPPNLDVKSQLEEADSGCPS
jgi:ribose transport system substrate-binding protein